MNRPELYRFFDDYAKQAGALSWSKNADYARNEDPFQNFNQCGEYGFVTRMSDKLTRLQNMIERGIRNTIRVEAGLSPEGQGVSDESVDDTIMDLFNYCWLLAAWRCKERQGMGGEDYEVRDRSAIEDIVVPDPPF